MADFLGTIFENPAIQKYFANLASGIAAGNAQQPGNPNAALGQGFSQAAGGQLDELTRQQAIRDQLDMEARRAAQQKMLMQQVLGGSQDLGDSSSLLAPGIPAQAGQSPEQQPQVSQQEQLMKKGLALILSGNPNLMAVGQNIMSVGSSLTPKERWEPYKTTVAGREIEAQRNTLTGEIKYPAAELITGGKKTYIPELRGWYDSAGNPVSAGTPGATQTPLMGTEQPQTSMTPIAPTGPTAQVPTLPRPKYDMNLTPAENARAIEEWNKGNQGLQTEAAKTQFQTQTKKIDEAKAYLDVDNLQAMQSAKDKSDSLISDLKTQIQDARKIVGSDIPIVQAGMRQLGYDPTAQLEATARNLVATKIGEMKSAGVVSAGQLNSDKDIDLQFGAIFNPDAPLAVQEKQLARLEQDAKAADKLIEAKKQKYKSYLGETYSPPEEPPKTPPNVIKGNDGRNYIKLPNGNYKLAP